MPDQVMTIRQMCDTYEVTPRTLRFYEQKELISPIRKGTRRLFTGRDRVRLKLILRGKRFGFSLEEIRQLLDLYSSGGDPTLQLSRSREIAVERLKDLKLHRDELNAAIDELKGQIDWVSRALVRAERERAA